MADTSLKSRETLPFTTRLWFAWVCFFRVLFDGAFAARAWQAKDARADEPAALPGQEARGRELPPATKEPPSEKSDKSEGASTARSPQMAAARPKAKDVPEAPSTTAALQLLALLQREGRLIDFLEQDIEPFSDADIGAAVRVVHAGCRKAVRGHAKVEAVRSEEEGATVTLPAGFNPQEVKLSGNVQGSAPYKGVLRHRGWRAKEITLPTPVAGHDPHILAPAEVEL